MKTECHKCHFYFGQYGINCAIFPEGSPFAVCPHWKPCAEIFFTCSEQAVAQNLDSYSINLADGISVLSDSQAITIQDFNEGKSLSVTLGMSAVGQLLVVTYKSTEQDFEVLEARLATDSELFSYLALHSLPNSRTIASRIML